MNILKIVPVLLLAGALACQNDAQDAEALQDSILGNWETVSATRNGEVTETLTGFSLDILPEGKMAVNLGGSREEVNYELTGTIISQKGGKNPLDYTVNSVNDSVLVLGMNVRGSAFILTMHRISPEN